jgi:hypothetical protein
MKWTVLAIATIFLMLSSCDSEPTEQYKKELENQQVVNSIECQISTMSFQMGGEATVLEFYYEESRLKKVETIVDGENTNRTMVFTLNPSGSIQAFLSGVVIARYVYDDDGDIVTINGERGMKTRQYEYDSKKRISKQITEVNGTPFVTHEYEYNTKNQPVVVRMYNSVGELLEINEITYDNKKNPFKNRGIFINNMDKLFGYPVGNQDHNIVRFKKTYQPQNTVGTEAEALKTEEHIIKYSYNKKGFPTEMKRLRNGRESAMRITYTCK